MYHIPLNIQDKDTIAPKYQMETYLSAQLDEHMENLRS